MKVLYLHAHYDDYEFTAAGAFASWRRRLGPAFEGRVVVCTDGAAGHHHLDRVATARVRLAEQEASARLGGFEFALLRLPDGTVPREACLQVTPPLLAALWRTIREFEPDYLLCPPLAADPLAGIHNDHETIAEAVRRVAYMINVPHAFTPEYPDDGTPARPCRVPVILNVYDSYLFGANGFDLAINIEEEFPLVAAMTWCHQSQIREWLPWVGRHRMAPPADLADWTHTLRARFDRKNRELGLPGPNAWEVFRITAWGEISTLARIQADLPGVVPAPGQTEALNRRLERWGAP